MRPAVLTTLIAGVLFGAAATPAAAQQASLPFPAGTKYAYVDLARILAESVHGRNANAQVQELTEQKRAEIEARQATLQTQIDAKNQNLLQLQQRLAQGETVMSTDRGSACPARSAGCSARFSVTRKTRRPRCSASRRTPTPS